MLIRARQEERIPSFQDLPPLKNVREDHSV
jgi:hypothetical protein